MDFEFQCFQDYLRCQMSDISVSALAVLLPVFESIFFFFKTAIYCLKLGFQLFCHLLYFDNIFLKVFCAIRGAIFFSVNDQATTSGQAIIKNSPGYFMVKLVAKTNSNLTNLMSNSISLKSQYLSFVLII